MPDPKAQIQAILNDLPDAALQELLAALQGAPFTAATTQVNLGDAKGYQVRVEGGTAYVGDQLHVDAATLEAVLNKLITERQQPQISGIPNNLPRSGAVEFVGREKDLAKLHTQLHQADRLAITALRGMGGIGKTELALQYALHHREMGTYPGGICWLQAKEQDIGTEIVNFALIYLNLTPPDGLDLPNQVAYIWQNCPTFGNVLVVIDDVSAPDGDGNAAYAAIKPYLPPQESRFRVLLTTRLQLGTSIHTVQIDVLSEAASLELLRSLAGTDRVNQEPDTAQALCEWLGYLPLGLELVGRFLARKPGWSLERMQQQLNAKRLEAKALGQAQTDMTAEHESIAAAFELSWQDLTPPAQDLAYRLSLFALAPIPWEWLEEWYESTDPDALEESRDEALVNRSLAKVVSVSGAPVELQLHQLIREFFRSKLEQWAGAETLKRDYCQAMVQVAQQIPQTPTRDQILAVTAAIPHLAEAATIWQKWLDDESVGWSFIGLGWFYQGQGAYGQAEPWLQNCLTVTRDRLGEAHPGVAISLNNLAGLYRSQGRYSEAEPLLQQALALRKQLLGEAHPHVAISLNNLAELYRAQGRYGEAEPLLQQALALRKQLLGNDHPDMASSLNNLAFLYCSQGRYSEAEPLYQQALALWKQLLGEAHPHVAISLNNLAELYYSQGRYSEAEPLFQQALVLKKQLLGDDHPDVATSLNNLALLYRVQGRYSEAELLYQQTLVLRKQLLGNDHPDVANSLNNLAGLYRSQGRYSEAELLFQQALALRKQLLGDDHPDVANSLNNLAVLYANQELYHQAEPLLEQALEMRLELLGSGHPHTQSTQQNLENVRRCMAS